MLRAVAAAPLLRIPVVHGQGAGARLLRFVPQADLGVLDPIVTTAYVTRNHALMVHDTLYGLDGALRPFPQMAEGHLVEEDGLRWTFRLRDGLLFHDGEPVRARDCVASIRRWAQRDPLGQLLAARTEAMEALDDRRFVIRLARPFGPMLEALGKVSSPICAIMPERLALTDAFRPVTEVVGCGPFRFRADERVAGARTVYERFDRYRPREDGPSEWTAGPKRVLLDRVEWQVMPDPSTAAAALLHREVDWWEYAALDLLPALRRDPAITVETTPLLGIMSLCRLNHLHPPFDNPALRRAVLRAVNQADFMLAAAGTEPDGWRAGVGFWPPGTPLASEAGMDLVAGPRVLERARREVREAGYRGEPVVALVSTDFPVGKAVGEVGTDLFRRIGLTVEHVATDFATVVQRRASREPVSRGGWSCFYTGMAMLDMLNPGLHQPLRGGGARAWFGWPSIPRMEALAEDWLNAADAGAQRAIGAAMQRLAYEEVPYLPLGQYFQPTAYRRRVRGVRPGPAVFWGVEREG
jgi:peptide/nickel transport system substrate-binding protein